MSKDKVKSNEVNPYERIFDDANRKLEKSGNKDFINNMDAHDDDMEENVEIPFPYGGRGNSSYNPG